MRKRKNKIETNYSPIYRYRSALYKSFYSKKLYVDVGKRWRGFGLAYFLVVVVLFLTPFVFLLSLSMKKSFNDEITTPLAKIPFFLIQNGKVSFDKPMPYLIKNNKGQVETIIDTTGTVNDFSKYPYLSILINKDRILFKKPELNFFRINEKKTKENTPIVEKFGKKTNMVFDGKKFSEGSFITNMRTISQLIVFPIVLAFFYSFFIVMYLFLGLLGQVFSRMLFNYYVSFMQSTRLMIVSGTPMFLVLCILLLSKGIFPGSGLILLTLLSFYYSFAILALRADSKKMLVS